MLSLSQSVGYAIQALTCLDEDPRKSRLVKDVAEETGVPAPYLAKLFKKLNDGDIVASKRGYKGGTWLRRSASEISLLDISEAIDGRKWLGRCLLGLDECSDSRSCPTHEFWKATRAEIEDRLHSTSLQEVRNFNRHRLQHSTHIEATPI